jgi:hypothetical protein
LFGSKRDDSGRYQLMLYTRPNNGLIEVMIDYRTISNNDSKIMIIGNPIRANKYDQNRNSVPLVKYYFSLASDSRELYIQEIIIDQNRNNIPSVKYYC